MTSTRIEHVTSLENSRIIKRLGVKQKSEFYWVGAKITRDGTQVSFLNSKDMVDNGFLLTSDLSLFQYPACTPTGETYSAYLASEIGKMLPDTFEGYKWIEMGRYDSQHVIQYQKIGNELNPIRKEADTEANARCLMLIYLLEQGIIKTEDINI